VYDPSAVLAAIDSHLTVVLLLCAVTFIGVYTWFIEAMRVGRRDRTYTFPIFCTAFWFAHDTSFVARYSLWFHEYDHWFFKLFWVAIITMIAMEFVYLRQTVRYGRAELFPRFSTRACTLLVAAALVSGIVVWSTIKAALNDDLYLISIGLTIAVYPPFAIALILRRGSTRGQSVLMWTGFCGLAIGWFSVTTTVFGAPFHTWQWILLGAFSIVGALAGLWLVATGKRYGLVDTDASDPGLVGALAS
jgi:hypothetical protein